MKKNEEEQSTKKGRIKMAGRARIILVEVLGVHDTTFIRAYKNDVLVELRQGGFTVANNDFKFDEDILYIGPAI